MHGTLRVIMKKILKQSQWNRIWDNFQTNIGLITVFNWKQFEDYYQHSPKSITHLLFQYFFESWRVEHYITIAISMLQISNKVNFFKPGEKDFEKLTFTWMTRPSIIALAIIQKRESQHGDVHKYMCVSKGKKCSFFGKCGVLCSLVTSVSLLLTIIPFSDIYNSSNLHNMNTWINLWEKHIGVTLCMTSFVRIFQDNHLQAKLQQKLVTWIAYTNYYDMVKLLYILNYFQDPLLELNLLRFFS